MINDNIPKSERLVKLNQVAIQQLKTLENDETLEHLKDSTIKKIDTK